MPSGRQQSKPAAKHAGLDPLHLGDKEAEIPAATICMLDWISIMSATAHGDNGPSPPLSAGFPHDSHCYANTPWGDEQ